MPPPPRHPRHDAASASQYKACRGKGSCGYQWNWTCRERCHRCNKSFGILRPGGHQQPAGAWKSPIKPDKKDWNGPKPDKKDKEKEHGDDDDTIGTLQKAYELVAKSSGKEDAFAKQLQLHVEQLKKDRLGAKPGWQQLRNLRGMLERKQKALEKATAATEQLEEEILGLGEKLRENQQLRAALRVEISGLEAEVRAAATKCADDEKAGATPSATPASVLALLPIASQSDISPELQQKVSQLDALLDEIKKEVQDTQAKRQAEEAQQPQRSQEAGSSAGGSATEAKSEGSGQAEGGTDTLEEAMEIDEEKLHEILRMHGARGDADDDSIDVDTRARHKEATRKAAAQLLEVVKRRKRG